MVQRKEILILNNENLASSSASAKPGWAMQGYSSPA
jgi:hypothetical protein